MKLWAWLRWLCYRDEPGPSRQVPSPPPRPVRRRPVRFGPRLAAARARRGCDIDYLAQLLGVPPDQAAAWETEQATPDDTTRARLLELVELWEQL